MNFIGTILVLVVIGVVGALIASFLLPAVKEDRRKNYAKLARALEARGFMIIPGWLHKLAAGRPLTALLGVAKELDEFDEKRLDEELWKPWKGLTKHYAADPDKRREVIMAIAEVWPKDPQWRTAAKNLDDLDLDISSGLLNALAEGDLEGVFASLSQLVELTRDKDKLWAALLPHFKLAICHFAHEHEDFIYTEMGRCLEKPEYTGHLSRRQRDNRQSVTTDKTYHFDDLPREDPGFMKAQQARLIELERELGRMKMHESSDVSVTQTSQQRRTLTDAEFQAVGGIGGHNLTDEEIMILASSEPHQAMAKLRQHRASLGR